jgi:branched-subunit amino acid transport protein
MACALIRFSPLDYASEDHVSFSTSVQHILSFTPSFIFTSILKSIYVGTHFLHTSTSINANIRNTRSDTVWLSTYKLQLTYGIILIK